MASAMACSKDYLFISSIGCIKVSGRVGLYPKGHGLTAVCVLGMGCHHSEAGSVYGRILPVLGQSSLLRPEEGTHPPIQRSSLRL